MEKNSKESKQGLKIKNLKKSKTRIKERFKGKKNRDYNNIN